MTDDLVKRLSRRIHNQRVRLREMEGFHWGMNHLATIRSYVRLYKARQEDRALIAEQRARLEADAARIARLVAFIDQAWHDGFRSARECLSDDEAFYLTDDVEHDAWRVSNTRTVLDGMKEG